MASHSASNPNTDCSSLDLAATLGSLGEELGGFPLLQPIGLVSTIAGSNKPF